MICRIKGFSALGLRFGAGGENRLYDEILVLVYRDDLEGRFDLKWITFWEIWKAVVNCSMNNGMVQRKAKMEIQSHILKAQETFLRLRGGTLRKQIQKFQ